MPKLVFSDERGRLFDHPRLLAAGCDGPSPTPLDSRDMIPVPPGSDLMFLPGRAPIGFDPGNGAPVVLRQFEGKPVCAAAAFMAPAHTASHRAAYSTDAGAPALPLYAYTALAFADDRFWAAGLRVDADSRQDPLRFDDDAIALGVRQTLTDLAENRVARQLETCALEYKCRAAQNFFLGRHEGPLPTSVACNSRCVGCLSLQDDGEFRAAHERLRVPPSAEEIAEVALYHIDRVPEAVVSFGQGCEGEPLIGDAVLRRSIDIIRRATDKGTINLNTNASRPDAIAGLIDAGLDSIRISLNSLRRTLYDNYYRPRGYSFDDVKHSFALARGKRIFVSFNLLYFPGITDTDAEVEAFAKELDSGGPDLIQMRNLNIDPELYVQMMPASALVQGMGPRRFMSSLKTKYPDICFGYFNPPKETFRNTV